MSRTKAKYTCLLTCVSHCYDRGTPCRDPAQRLGRDYLPLFHCPFYLFQFLNDLFDVLFRIPKTAQVCDKVLTFHLPPLPLIPLARNRRRLRLALACPMRARPGMMPAWAPRTLAQGSLLGCRLTAFRRHGSGDKNSASHRTCNKDPFIYPPLWRWLFLAC